MIEKKTSLKLLLIFLTLFISMMSVLKDGFSMSITAENLNSFPSSFPSSITLINQLENTQNISPLSTRISNITPIVSPPAILPIPASIGPSSILISTESTSGPLESASSGPVVGPSGPVGPTGPSSPPDESTISVGPNEIIKATISTSNIAHDISTAVLANPIEQSVIQAATTIPPHVPQCHTVDVYGSPMLVCS